MKVSADGFAFDFTDALDAFVFDETDRSRTTYHGQPMKAVDLIVELREAYLFVEMKDFHDPETYDHSSAVEVEELKAKRQSFKWLKNVLKYKYRDTYLFRHAEEKVDKPIHYLCLLTFDNALNGSLKKALHQELPVGVASKRWKREIVNSCQVVNVDKWNQNFPKWPVVHAQLKA